MAVDFALDENGDLRVSPSNDVALVSGIDEVEQRIKFRIRTMVGTWQFHPTFGSSLFSLLRLSPDLAVPQVPLMVKEALAPMSDISVRDVNAWLDPDDPKKIDFTVEYALVDNEAEGDQLVLNDSLVVTA